MYSYLQQQLIIPWLLVTIYLNDFLSADPQPQQQQPAMITHHPLEDFNKHLLFLSGLHHVHPLVLPHPLLAGGPQTLPVHHPGLPHLPPPFQLPTALMQQPALSPMLENILVVTASPSQTGTLIKTQEQMSVHTTVTTTTVEPMTSTTTGTSAVGHAHPQAIRPTLSLASKQEHVLLTNSSEEHSTRRKNQAKTVQDQKENMMLQDLEVTLEAKSNGPTIPPTTTTTTTAPNTISSPAKKSTSSYGGVVQSPTPKTTLKGKVIKTAASIETVPIKQPTSVFIKEEHANLIRQHLDNTDLESFLHSANLSAHDAQIFLKLVEKVLEEEVSKRLQKHSTTTLSETSIPTTTASSSSLQMNTNSTPTSSFAPMKAELITNQPSIQQPNLEDEEIEDKLLTHELKTVNTRLSYVSEELENGGGSNPTESKTNSRLGLASINLDPISISPTTRLPPPTHKMASIRTSIGPVIVAGDSYSSPSPQESEDYRTQEQDEFDRLLDKLSVESSQGRRTSGDRVRTEDSDLLAAASFRDRLTRPRVEIAPQRAAHSKSVIVPQSETSEAPFTPGAFGQQLMNARHNKFSVRHQPKTEFEHLVQDYRYRLSGHNGINDLIKALKNAHIGFFPTRGGGIGQRTDLPRPNKRLWRELI